jgi:hypothetical protein
MVAIPAEKSGIIHQNNASIKSKQRFSKEMLKKTFPGFFQLGSQKARFSTSSIFYRLQRSKMPGRPWPAWEAH